MADETLKITGGNAAGQTITLEQELVIGRSTPGLGSLGGDSEISRVHARVFNDPSGRLMVEDLGSTNGTFVNGNRVTGQQALNPGDELRVGQTTMSVEGGAGAGATTVGNVVATPPPAAPAPPPQQPPTQQLPPTGQQPAAPPPPQPVGQGPGAPPPPGGGPAYGGGPVGGPPQRAGGGPNRTLLYALGALLLIGLIVAGLAIGGVFGGDDEESEPTAQTTTTPTTTTPTTETTEPPVAMPDPPPEPDEPTSGDDYPPGFRKQFVDSCAQGGAPREICGCTFDRLQDQYTFPEFVELLGKADGGNLPPPVRNAVQQCAG